MSEKQTTLAEFKANFNGRGDSIMEMAYHAQFVSDDEEVAAAAKAALTAEDDFYLLLLKRDITN